MRLVEIDLAEDEEPPKGSVHQGGRLYLVSDREAAKLSAAVVADRDVESKFPIRDDLPKDHPFYGLRVLKNGASGSRDITPEMVKSDYVSIAEIG